MSFWKSKPLEVLNEVESFEMCCSIDEVKALAEKDMEKSRVKFDYRVIKSPNDGEKRDILDFINKNYTSPQEDHQLIYDIGTLDYYLRKDGVIVVFTPKNKPNTVGVAIGAPRIVCSKNNMQDILADMHRSFEVNFLCIVPQLRDIHASSFMISAMTKVSIDNYGIGIGHFTTADTLKTSHYGEKNYYHRPINVVKLLEGDILPDPSDVAVYTKVYTTFNYPFQFLRNKKIKCFDVLEKTDQYEDVLRQIHMMLSRYNQLNYLIYEHRTIDDIESICNNKSFLKFLIIDNYGQILDIVILNIVGLRAKASGVEMKAGNLYCCSFSESSPAYKSAVFELVSEYCFAAHDDPLIDMMTVMDIFPFKEQYRLFKFTKGTGQLYYYWYNMHCQHMAPLQNGLTTL
jgi:hypothetical protein